MNHLHILFNCFYCRSIEAASFKIGRICLKQMTHDICDFACFNDYFLNGVNMKDKDWDPQISENDGSIEDDEIIQLIDELGEDEDEEVIELSDIAGVSTQKDETPEGASEPAEINISDEKLERALERVIQRTFSEKAEQMLTEAIEKAVVKEIDKLKRILLEASSGEEKT